MSILKVLVVDDTEDSVKGIIDYCEDNDWEPRLCGFDDVYTETMTFNPDVIVLDWFDDSTETDYGSEILENLWSNAFRPLVVFSANEPMINIDEHLKHSTMLRLIQIGRAHV